jgi:hypothetical protein
VKAQLGLVGRRSELELAAISKRNSRNASLNIVSMKVNIVAKKNGSVKQSCALVWEYYPVKDGKNAYC